MRQRAHWLGGEELKRNPTMEFRFDMRVGLAFLCLFRRKSLLPTGIGISRGLSQLNSMKLCWVLFPRRRCRRGVSRECWGLCFLIVVVGQKLHEQAVRADLEMCAFYFC